MAYLIDGNNLLGHLAAEELRDPRGRDGLILRLLTFQRATRKRIYLVFDGRPSDDDTHVTVNNKFSVIYPEAGESADSIIHEMIGRQVDKRTFFVVSSDREIRDAACSRGIQTLSSEEFGRELTRVIKDQKKMREMDKHVERPSPLEVRLWDDVFKTRR